MGEEFNYKRTIAELELNASMFWSPELSAKESELSIIPKLIETQDQFISILSVNFRTLENLFNAIEGVEMSANLFLKHLVVISDFGGEMLQRVNRQFVDLFPKGELRFFWKERENQYRFSTLPVGNLNNDKLGVSGKKLQEPRPLGELYKDVIALLLFGGSSVNESTAHVLAKCELGNLLGRAAELDKFIRERYIWVSRITGGAQSNSLGHLAQNFVKDFIAERFKDEKITIVNDGNLPNVTHSDPQTGQLTTFDIVISNGVKFVAVEISFQVTTNSVIERKSGQALERLRQARAAGHKIAYVIDGAGNFQRKNAVGTICSHSDCTVAFTKVELEVLCNFISDFFNDNIK
ncbi:MAG: hypothetical protein KIS76_10170 [Pyrinomonadaceae bacterium]|nr:hypothetical protein [Pyrinomonadaceae bacterium]